MLEKIGLMDKQVEKIKTCRESKNIAVIQKTVILNSNKRYMIYMTYYTTHNKHNSAQTPFYPFVSFPTVIYLNSYVYIR